MAARTDMAVESGNVSFQYDWDKKVQGMIYRKLFVDDDLAKRLKKGKGIYYNIDQVDYLYKQKPATKLLMTAIQDCLSDLKLEENSDILICGLGNDSVTPDALGPLVINKIEVNRHRSDTAFRFTTSAMCPGVMGQTGMESSEIIKAVVDDFKPRLVIVVDALACNDPARMCHSIQLSTAGINPGSGVGNKRKEISKKHWASTYWRSVFRRYRISMRLLMLRIIFLLRRKISIWLWIFYRRSSPKRSIER